MSRIMDDPKKVKALIKSFQAETRTTRAQGGHPYYIPEGISINNIVSWLWKQGWIHGNSNVEIITVHHLNLTHVKLTYYHLERFHS